MKYTYWVIKPKDNKLEPLERTTQWELPEIYETIGDGCNMMEIIRLSPILANRGVDGLGKNIDVGDLNQRKIWQTFIKKHCMVVDEEFLIKNRTPAPNFLATMMRMEPIHGVAIVTPWDSID